MLPNRLPRRECRGLTLLELLIALAIVAILAALAYPSYQEQVQRGRRLDAVGALLELRVAQEGWRGQHSGYATLDELGWPAASPDGFYRLELIERNAVGFRLLATPRPDGPQQGDACGVYALNQNGPVLTTGYADANCWRP